MRVEVRGATTGTQVLPGGTWGYMSCMCGGWEWMCSLPLGSVLSLF